MVDERTRVMPTPAERSWGALVRWQQVVWLVAAVLTGLIAIRFVLVAMGANMALGFGQLLFGITQPFDLPFLMLFGDQNKAQAKGASLELGSIIAIIVYLLLAWTVNRILSLIMAPRVATP